MNILMAAGGIKWFDEDTAVDSISSLSRELNQRGHEVSIVLPFCYSLGKNREPKATDVRFFVPLGNQRLPCEIFETRNFHGTQIFFIKVDEPLKFQSGEQDPTRILFYTRCVVDLARHISPSPEIIHCYDWQAAFVPVWVKTMHLPFQTVLSIDTLERQGSFERKNSVDIPGEYLSAVGFHGTLNFLQAGILFSDAVVLPSKRFVYEAQHSCGHGLESLLHKYSQKLHGLLPGIDESTWNPQADQSIPATYGAGNQEGKSLCAAKLLSELHLAPSPRGPVVAIKSDFVEQSGWALFLGAIDRMLVEDIRVIILGTVPTEQETAVRIAVRKHRSKLCYCVEKREIMESLILSGSDLFLLPSEIEWSGMPAVRALKYGAIPLARACHGLGQFIEDYDEIRATGTAFIFYEASVEAFLDSLRRAIILFENQQIWKNLVARALSTDYSWRMSAQNYERLYNSLLASPQPTVSCG